MALSILTVQLTTTPASIIGAAAGQVGVTWQNEGPNDAILWFVAATPGANDARHVLRPGDAWYDRNGSAGLWAAAAPGLGGAKLSATRD